MKITVSNINHIQLKLNIIFLLAKYMLEKNLQTLTNAPSSLHDPKLAFVCIASEFLLYVRDYQFPNPSTKSQTEYCTH